MLKEFKEFAIKGNVVDMAIGVVIGAAFSRIVSSLLSDVLMPPVGLLMGRVDFSSLFISLNGQAYPSLAVAKEAGAPTINYGLFLNTLLDFVIVAFTIFLVIKQINRLKRPAAAPEPVTKLCPFCLSDIPIRASRCGHCTSTLEGAR